MAKSTTFSVPFERSLLAPVTKLLRTKISFIFKKTYIENQYELFSITWPYGSSMLEGVYFTVSYAPVEIIKSLIIIITIESTEGLLLLSWTYPMPSIILFYQILKISLS